MKKSPAKKPAVKAQAERPVLVTTSHRGVFFGYVTGPTSGAILKLKRARNCIYWSGLKGFLDLAVTGPNKNCRIGTAAQELELRDITSVSEVTPVAMQAWEAAPWNC